MDNGPSLDQNGFLNTDINSVVVFNAAVDDVAFANSKCVTFKDNHCSLLEDFFFVVFFFLLMFWFLGLDAVVTCSLIGSNLFFNDAFGELLRCDGEWSDVSNKEVTSNVSQSSEGWRSNTCIQ